MESTLRAMRSRLIYGAATVTALLPGAVRSMGHKASCQWHKLCGLKRFIALSLTVRSRRPTFLAIDTLLCYTPAGLTRAAYVELQRMVWIYRVWIDVLF